MPRGARRKSESGIYHIMMRGINRQQIFEDEEDNLHFIETLSKYKEQCGYSIYAYCLMGNHLHILLKEHKEDLTLIFKRIAGSYVYWYNWKYHRTGHLFQDRFMRRQGTVLCLGLDLLVIILRTRNRPSVSLFGHNSNISQKKTTFLSFLG